MGLFDTLQFDLFNQGPVGQTFETDPRDQPVGNLPEGYYQSLFRDTNGPGVDPRTIGNIAHGISAFGSTFLGKPTDGVSAPAPHRGVSYNPTDFRATETPALRAPTDRSFRPLDIQSIEARLEATNKAPDPFHGPRVRVLDYTHPSIGGRLAPADALKAFHLGYKHG